MKRTTISLTDDLAVLLEREARRREVSISEIVRESLMARFGLTASQPRRIPFASLGSSGHRHTARDAEEILSNEWGRAVRPRHCTAFRLLPE